MGVPQGTYGRVLARDIVAYTDAELSQYLEEHRLEGGGATVVDVEDPENLPERFIQRLRDFAQHASNAARSRPIDLDQVTARLLATPADNNPSPHPSFPSFSSEGSADTLPPIPLEVGEREDYNELVNNGGRPVYPIDLIDEIAQDPFAHWDMLRPWVDRHTDPDPVTDPDVDWAVFGTQMWHWKEFRRWQTHNRRAGRPRYVEVDPRFGSTDRAFNIFVWEFRRGSANYTEAAKKLLAQYDFTRPFRLQEDPERQDKLATWIEYLVFACAEHYRYTGLVKRHQPGYDTAWKTLVDSAVLRSSETEEHICDITSAFQRQSEEDMAQKAVKSAEAALVAVQRAASDPQRARLAPSTNAETLASTQFRLDAARDSLKSIQRRNDLVTTFRGAARSYRKAKEDADQHSLRLRWILEQVPLIKAELQASDAAQGGPHTGRGTKRRVTSDQDDEVTNDRPPQKRSRSSRIGSLTNDGPRSPEPGKVPSKHSRRDDRADDERPSKRLRKRHSGGILEVTPRNQGVARRNTRLRGSATKPTKGSTPDYGPTRSKRASGAPGNLSRGTRSSRRLAGDPPEFGMVLERRGALPLDVQQPLAGSQRGQQAAKGAKPQGISRSRENKTASTKRSSKRW